MKEKEIYYKVFNHRNQLMLVTPTLGSVREFLGECLDVKISSDEFTICNSQRFYEGYRITKVEL